MKMAALKCSLMALTALLTFSICSAIKVKTDHLVAGPVPVPSGPIIHAPIPAGPVPSGPVPVPSGPSPSGNPVIAGPVPSGPVPVPSGPSPSGNPVIPGPIPSGPVPIPSGPVPVPAMEAGTSAHAVKPPVKMNSEATSPPMTSTVDDNEVGANCVGGGWGCGGGGMPGCGGYGCGGCPPAAPKNPYYCQPEANCVGSPGYGSGNGFTIYLGDHFPSSDSDDQLKS